jgi:hypothetical protein
MEATRFDQRTRQAAGSRRRVLGLLGTTAVGGLGLAWLARPEGGAAKTGGKQRKRRRCSLKSLRNRECTQDKQCCPNNDYVCGVPALDTRGVLTRCCGKAGARCAHASDCCQGFGCRIDNSTCAPLPPP